MRSHPQGLPTDALHLGLHSEHHTEPSGCRPQIWKTEKKKSGKAMSLRYKGRTEQKR